MPDRPQVTRAHALCMLNNYGHKHTLSIRNLLFFHCNNGHKNAPRYYVICTLPILFYISIGESRNVFILRPGLSGINIHDNRGLINEGLVVRMTATLNKVHFAQFDIETVSW